MHLKEPHFSRNKAKIHCQENVKTSLITTIQQLSHQSSLAVMLVMSNRALCFESSEIYL